LADFLNLVRNENMKIYYRVRTWVMSAILLVLPLAMSIIGRFVDDSPNMWSYVMLESGLMTMLLSIFAVVMAADSVAGEFSNGTIKLLLIRPWSRNKILLSKYLALLCYIVLNLAVFFALTLLLNFVLFGGGDSGSSIPSGWSPFGYVTAWYGLNLIEMAVVATMAFMISSVFRSGGLAIGLSIFALLGSGIISSLLSLIDKPWIDYVLFMHFGLERYLNAGELFRGHSLGFSLGVLAGYYVLFLALSWYVFNRRDVAS